MNSTPPTEDSIFEQFERDTRLTRTSFSDARNQRDESDMDRDKYWTDDYTWTVLFPDSESIVIVTDRSDATDSAWQGSVIALDTLHDAVIEGKLEHESNDPTEHPFYSGRTDEFC